MSNPELQALLANLRPRSQAPSTSDTPNPPPAALHSSPPATFSPTASTRNSGPGNATAQNLLNLLNFNHSATAPQAPEPARQPSFSGSQASTARPAPEPTTFTAADLLARAASSQPRSSPGPQISTAPDAGTLPTSASQLESKMQDPVSASSPATPMAQDGSRGIFTYKNPFEALRASRPHTPRASQPPAQEGKKGEDVVQSIEDPATQQALNTALPERARLTPKSRDSLHSTPAPAQTNGESSHAEAATVEPPAQPFPAYGHHGGKSPDADRPVETMDDTGGGHAPENGDRPRVVPVLSFPVKAFVSLTLHLRSPAESKVREDAVMEISRLKKEFDQIDRSLAAASSKFITYALVKNGGMRIIRQDDGKDKHIFKHSHDRVFNVAICSTSMTQPPLEHQAVLGTGISGAVYYATLSKPDHDFFDAGDLESESLIFPAHPPGDENTAGGILKTRAKRSSRHPQFFAIGRGKAITLVWPSTVMSSRYGVTPTNRHVNMERLFQDRALQILTGKAGKDFTFSDDDTMIVSLDKTGRLRFWDIRKLIDEDNAQSMQITPYVIDTPVLSLQTSSGTEKSWPTSVLFLDKARPYTKCSALRYVLVGLRQNHTLQLWDIALGKAVQEINFPHENETDGICSVAYHPASGVIVVGHPTRNSIFFIHLSAPRYILSTTLSQASYVSRVATKDPDIPKPESTACMSGIREISFEGRGQLRSLELLPLYKGSGSAQDNPDALFELYVAHSTGVTCLVISKPDLGWDSDNKIVHNINAEEEGLVTLKELRLGSIIDENAGGKSPTQDTMAKQKKKKEKKAKEVPEETANGTQEREPESTDVAEGTAPDVANTETSPVEQPAPKEAKKDKKKKKEVAAETAQKPEAVKKPEPVPHPTGETHIAPSKPLSSPSQHAEPLSMSISGDWLDKELKKIERGVAEEFRKELDSLYQNIKTDRASQDQTSASRQEAVLRVVSQTLNNNVETSLSKILQKQMEEFVVPSVVQTVSTSLSQQITQAVSLTVKTEIGSELAVQVDRTLQSQQMLTRIADNVATLLTNSVQQEISRAINSSVSASMKAIATIAANEVVAAAETRMADQITQLQRQHASFNEKVEQLNSSLHNVAETLKTMSQAQAFFQNQVLQDRRAPIPEHSQPASAAQHGDPASFVTSPASNVRAIPAVQPPRQKTKAELEVEEVTALMEQRKYEEGSIKWLQSSQPVKLFDDLFCKYTPDYLATDVSPLVAFSIGVTVANSLATNTEQRLEWIGAAFDTIDFKDREIIELAQHAPQLLNGMISKLDNLYMQRSQTDPYGNVARMVPPLVQKARQLLGAFQAVSEGHNLTMGYVAGGRNVIE